MLIEVTVSTSEKAYEANISSSTPIFAKDEKGKLVGMIVKEDQGWIIRIGGDRGASGYHEDRYACMNASIIYNLTFHIEE